LACTSTFLKVAKVIYFWQHCY